jgi:hypothetical protein
MNKVYELRDREEFTEVGRTLTDRAGHRTPCLVSSRAFVRNAYPSCSALTSTWMGAGVGQEAVRVLLVSSTRSRDANFLTQACLDASLEYACNVQLVLLSSEFPSLAARCAYAYTPNCFIQPTAKRTHAHILTWVWYNTHPHPISFLNIQIREKRWGQTSLCIYFLVLCALATLGLLAIVTATLIDPRDCAHCSDLHCNRKHV